MKTGSILFSILAITAIVGYVGYSVVNRDGLQTKLVDGSSFANINDVKTLHYDLDLKIDFDEKVFVGRQVLHLESTTLSLTTVDLDIEDIQIFNITDRYGAQMEWTVENPNPRLGQKLVITIPSEWHFEKFTLTIDYKTATTASAVTWLHANQTSGGKLPYMYTQCESIHARSIAPLQDTPAIKSTYNLNFTTPEAIIVRASGNRTHEYTDETNRYTSFEMGIPVESYLLAIAAGNLAEKQVGDRTYVITEPEDLEKAAKEFEDLEDALVQAEEYLTPYVWGVYKLLILPPSFPFGGMENPLLTFASPAIVVGDKSSVDVAVHEICHSWFGNLVTNVNWSNFWLNEGFTVFFERKVDSLLSGITAAKVSAKLENQTMYFNMLDFGMDSNYSSLTPQPNGNHPDDSFSVIPYEKGFQFLTYLESLVDEDIFQEFLQTYINEFAETSIDSDEFVKFFTKFLHNTYQKKEAQKILDQIDFDTWIHAPGLPPVTVDLETQEYKDAIQMAENFMQGVDDPDAPAKYQKFSVNLKGLVISHWIQNIDNINKTTVANIDDKLGVSKEINGELIHRWLQVAIRSGYLEAPYDAANQFLGAIGRMKFVVPVYTSLYAVNPDKAKEIYAGHKDFYHPIARVSIEAVLNTPTLSSE